MAFATFIPSKIFEYLASGTPVIGAVRGEPATILEEAGQLVVEPGDPQALAKAVSELAADPRVRGTMGADGRRAVTEQFDRRALARRYRTLLAPLARRNGTRR